MVGFGDVLTVAVYLLPGYIVLHTIKLHTEYLEKKGDIEKLIQIVVFSFFSYSITFLIYYTAVKILSEMGVINWPSSEEYKIILSEVYYHPYFISFFILLLPISWLIGVIIGKYVIKNDLNHIIIGCFSKRKTLNPPSLHSFLLRQFLKKHEQEKDGLNFFMTFYLDNGTILIGRVIKTDFNEEERDYSYIMDEVDLIDKTNQKSKRLAGNVMINESKVKYFEIPKYIF